MKERLYGGTHQLSVNPCVQVQACRQATQATQGDSVQERLRGGTSQPSVIPGMEFEEEKKKKKPAKK